MNFLKKVKDAMTTKDASENKSTGTKKAKSKTELENEIVKRVDDCIAFYKITHERQEESYSVYEGLTTKRYNKPINKDVVSGRVNETVAKDTEKAPHLIAYHPTQNLFRSYVKTLRPFVYQQGKRPIININPALKDSQEKAMLASYADKVLTAVLDEESGLDVALEQASMNLLIAGCAVFKVEFEQTDATSEEMDAYINELLQDEDFLLEMEMGQYSDEDVIRKYAKPYSVKNQKVIVKSINPLNIMIDPVETFEDATYIIERIYTTKQGIKDFFAGKVKIEDVDTLFEKGIPYNTYTQSSKIEDFRINEKYFYYQLWDKETKMVYYIANSKIIHKEEDPYQLKDFFPYSKPAMEQAGLGIKPQPPLENYYRLIERINACGVLLNILSEVLNRPQILIANDKARKAIEEAELLMGNRIFVIPPASEKNPGGMVDPTKEMQLQMEGIKKSAMDGMQMIVNVILPAYQAQYDKETGIADVIQGYSHPNETAEAVKTKNSNAMLRVTALKDIFEESTRDTYRKVTDMVFGLMLDKEIQKRVGDDTINIEFNAILKDDDRRCYLISTETDSMSMIKALKQRTMQEDLRQNFMTVLPVTLQLNQQGLIPIEAVKTIINAVGLAGIDDPTVKELPNIIERHLQELLQAQQMQAQQQMQEAQMQQEAQRQMQTQAMIMQAQAPQDATATKPNTR